MVTCASGFTTHRSPTLRNTDRHTAELCNPGSCLAPHCGAFSAPRLNHRTIDSTLTGEDAGTALGGAAAASARMLPKLTTCRHRLPEFLPIDRFVLPRVRRKASQFHGKIEEALRW